MNVKVKDLTDGQSLTFYGLVTNLVKGVTSNGAPYLSVTLSDNTGSIEGKVWDVKEEQAKIVETGRIYEVRCEVLKYRNALQLRVHSLNNVDQQSFDLAEFVTSSWIAKDVLKEKVKDAIYSVRNEIYRKILIRFFTDYQQEFFDYPAASKNHHNFVGGLATHVVGMLDIANDLCQLYPQLNRDLLISGVLLHDIGKITELSGPIATEYTLQGKLLGHISVMNAKVAQVAQELGYADSEEETLLRHMVLSHHGKLEYGSPVMQYLMEAEVLSLIDNLDARIIALTTALSNTEEGSFTSRLFPLENRAFYKPKTK